MKTIAISDAKTGVTILIRTSLENPQCYVLPGLSEPELLNQSSSATTTTDCLVKGVHGVNLITVVRPTAELSACPDPLPFPMTRRLRAMSVANG